MKPTNATQPEQIVQNIWNGIKCLQCKKLVDSMSRRIDRCIKSRDETFCKY